MRKLITIAICFCLLVSCSNHLPNEDKASAYKQQKISLASEEKQQPLSFLKVYASNKKNVFGSTVVKGAVSNSAALCSYKNVRLKLLGFDKNGKMLEEHEDVINDKIAPNTSKDFRLRYHLPKSVDSVSVSVMSASVAE